MKNGYTWAVDADIRRGHEMYDRRTQQKRLRGWYEYFKHSHKTTFPRIDSWIRMRLRSILRKSRGGKGSAGAQAIRDGQMRTLPILGCSH